VFICSFLDEFWSGSQRIEAKILERMTISVRRGVREKNPKYWEAGESYAREATEHCEENLRRGIDGVPIPSSP
jgi:hypothetical protein